MRLALAALLLFAISAAPASAQGLNCSDFSSQAAAQYYFNVHPGDPDGLDGNDHDGIACESNPCPCYYGTATGPTPRPPPADTDGDGVPDASDTCPTVPAQTPNGCPPPVDTDGDGLTDDMDACPTQPANTDDGCPPPPRVLIGDIDGFKWTDRLLKPRSLVPCSGDGTCRVIRTKWRNWGKATATGRGIARFNDCRPFCAEGRIHKLRGARIRAYRLRKGACDDETVRYYTRARFTWPRRSHIRRMTLKLKATCPDDTER